VHRHTPVNAGRSFDGGRTMVTNTLTLVNHASVLIKGERQSILTDPWYEGEAFHRGWRLLYENKEHDIEYVLHNTKFIWISHEHPDHFSIGFFRKYKSLIIDNNIVVMFQHTKDKRVIGFLKKSGFQSMELPSGEPFALEDKFTVRIVKDEFYDSALLVNVAGIDIFNLNDCAMHSPKRLTEFKNQYGTCDVLLTQFSYAAWKGGRDHVQWRRSAAEDKLASLVRQGRTLQAKTVIPFASFIYFANVLNSYLNDAVNSPRRVRDYCRAANADFRCVFLKPMESIDLDNDGPKEQESSLSFWENALNSNKAYIRYEDSYSLDQLSRLFKTYCERLQKKNSWWLIRLCRYLCLAFRPTTMKLVDTGDVVRVDLARRVIAASTAAPDIALHSESLAFIFKFPYGFDTLGVNGTFEELRRGGFDRFTKTFAIENLNNIGYSFKLALAFDLNVVLIFMGRLMGISRKLNAGKPATSDVVRARAA
jgi:beta-lactamase family protein